MAGEITRNPPGVVRPPTPPGFQTFGGLTTGSLTFPKQGDPNRIIEERDFSEADRAGRVKRSSESLLGLLGDDVSSPTIL